MSQIRIMWGWQQAARLSPCQDQQGDLGVPVGRHAPCHSLTHWSSLVGKTSVREGVTSVPTLGWNDAVEESGRDPGEGSEQPWFFRSWPSMLGMCLTFV